MNRKKLLEQNTSSITFGTHCSGTTIRNGKVVGFSESEGRGRTASADVKKNGNLSFNIIGKPSQGEDGTLQTCKLLVTELNRNYGGSWDTPYLVEKENIDAESVNKIEIITILKIQVVRAITERTLLKKLGKTKKLSLENITTCDTAYFLKKAIEHKENKISKDERKEITLALNAIDTPAVCFDDVVLKYRKKYGEWTSKLGFSDVWLIGPVTSMIHNLAKKPA